MLLCDVFEKFINVCLSYYNLDPCHYFSSPGLSWDTMFKMTGIQLEKINNIDVHLFLVFHIFKKDTVKVIVIRPLCI